MNNKIHSLLILTLAVIAVACGPNREQRIQEIETIEDSISEYAAVLDTVVAENLTTLYLNFSDKYPTDSLAPVYLFKAADIQSNLLHTERAISLFNRVIDSYPDFEEVPMCYFLIGNAYELNDQYDEARAAYQLFIDKYPDHFMAEQTRIMLPRVGMTPEEMLEDILANAADSI